ncbi:MAG: homoserine O-acetyltransferase [Bacteroidales bacterium]|jgi:homoserine O-acetyltransferase|nr:homoserine O-acetyltransferase [Bacteroidales bacterium]MCI1784923.1 homoserine O-acetyltransferase [Bacteroidales bacterium]
MTPHLFNYKGTFDFEAGGSIKDLHIAYHTSPRPYEAGDKRKVIWICHALTANSDAEDWWPQLTGPGKLFDTEKYFVICANILGSCYGSSGPSSINPDTGKPYYFNFPKITVRDITKAIDLLRISLGIKKIDFIVGASIGGFMALEWSIMNPELIKKAVYFATGARVTPWLTAFEESQRMALEADPSFRECKSLDGGKEALKCARTIALLSYRCEKIYNETQKEENGDTLFADRACSYHRYQGKKLADRFDAYSYYYLSYSIDSNNVGRNRGGVDNALGKIQADSTLISIDSDLLFTPEEIEDMAEKIHGSKYHEIHSRYGHDGFLLENSQIGTILKPVIDNL